MSGAISPLDVRSKTAKKLVSESTINILSDIMDLLEEGEHFEAAEVPLTLKEEETVKSDKGLRRELGIMKRPPKRPPFEKRLKEVKKGLDKIMTELEANVKKSLEDNKDEKRVQIILSIILFMAGVTVISMGLLRNQLEIVATSAIPGILIIYPYNNLTKIRRENTFLYLFVSWIKTNLLPCELQGKPEDIEECYKKGLEKLNSWMKQLQEKTYGA